MGHRNTSNMNTLVVLSLVVCAVSAGVIPAHHGAHYGGASEQHHSQDEAGNYAYGYSDPNSHKEESAVATPYGPVVKGSYSYTTPDGQVIVNEYYADENGFRSSLAPTAEQDVHPAPEYAPEVYHPASSAHIGYYDASYQPYAGYHHTALGYGYAGY